MGQGLITNYSGIVAMRFTLGIFEAGLFPGQYLHCLRKAILILAIKF
jgi:hypothetical protein